jgi:hypothetical protein
MSARTMSPAGFLRYLLLPAKPAGLMLIAVMTLGVALCSFAGLFGLPILVILLSWLFKYAFVLLEQVAHGAREPPVLSVEMVNPASELRPWILLAIVLAVYLSVRALSGYLGTTLTLILEGLAFAALPASIAVLGVASVFWQAINPLALWHVVRALGLTYLGIVVVVLIYGYGIAALAATAILPSWLINALYVFAWLSLFSLLGGSLFEAREALGHEAMHAPERAADKAQRQVERERSAFIDAAYAQMRSGNLAGAWLAIESRLGAHHRDRETYDWLLERLERLDDARLANRLAQDQIRHALGRDNGRVVEILRRRLALDPLFRPRSAAETVRVAQLARLSGDRSSAQRLLGDFATHFGDAPPALQSAAQAEIQRLESRSA